MSIRARRPLFAERSAHVPHVAAPILGQFSARYVSMKARMRPIAYARNKPMLHRIEMDVVDVPRQICVVADRVLPVAALPNPFLSLDDMTRRARGRDVQPA